MKKIALIIIMILCLLTTAACNERKTENQSNTTDSTSTQDVIEIKEGFKSAEYTYDSLIYNFDWGDQRNVNDLSIAIDIPDYYVKSDVSYIYERYDKELVMYLPALEISTAFQVDGDFIIDETVHSKTKAGGTWSPLEGWNVLTGRTKSGYDYVIYENKREKEYDAWVYVRVSDKYIVSLKYRDLMENYNHMAESIDSIQINNLQKS